MNKNYPKLSLINLHVINRFEKKKSFLVNYSKQIFLVKLYLLL
jgi:hypothetical protein